MELKQLAREFTRLGRGVAGARRVEPEVAAHPINGSLNGSSTIVRRGSWHAAIDPQILKETPIVMPTDPGPAAHAYRMLRTQLLQRVRQQAARAIGIVSAADREGKTLTAINLALSLAVEPNQTVLLADLDLRRPGVAATLRINPPHGLEAWFDGRVDSLADVIYPVDGFERLFILPTLCPVSGSSEAIATVRARNMLGALKSLDSGRIVVIDLPPLLLTDEFLTIAPHLDGVIVVAREGRTKREDLGRVGELLGSVRLLGTVLNHAADFERRAY